MKGTLLILVFTMIGSLAIGQSDAIDKYFSAYANDDNFSKVVVSSKMFELFAHMEGSDQDEKELLETISKLKGMRMIMNDSADNAKSLYTSALKKMGKEFEVLMTVEDDGDDVTIYLKETGGIISELVVIGVGNKEFFVMSLVGVIDLKQVAKLSRSLQIDGMQHLENVGGK